VTVHLDLPVPSRALAIGAHSDDVEFGCGATLAKWAAGGCEVHLLVCTDGSKGTWDADADLDALAVRRKAEQHDAAGALGVRAVHFLDVVDGELTADRDTHARVCEVIRTARPDVVLAHDPWRTYRLHPDHRTAGVLALDAVVSARDPHFFADQPVPHHRPERVLLFEAERVRHVERLDGAHVDAKIAALLCHRSQWRSTMGIADRPDEQRRAFEQQQRDAARAAGLRAGVRYAEAFARIDGV
jgi:LmbE family N-acetylglucosaminyl deacetylase